MITTHLSVMVNNMACTRADGTPCTRCCEVIHIDKKVYSNWQRSKLKLIDADKVFGGRGLWTKISKRRAKKLNPYLFSKDNESLDWVNNHAVFFICSALISGVGCSIHGTNMFPNVCDVYKGGNDYSPTCNEDIVRVVEGLND